MSTRNLIGIAGNAIRPLAVVLHGEIPAEAPPDEQDTLIQAQAIMDALQRLGWRAERLAATLDLEQLRRDLLRREPALVFNLVESLGGSGRLIAFVPALLDELRMPYTGVPTGGLFLSSHKVMAKRLMAQHGIGTPDWVEAGGAATAQPGDAASPLRWILKSVWEHASLGMDDAAVVERAGGDPELEAMLTAKRRRHGGEWFAEAYVEGREFNISIIENRDGPQVLPLAEIVFEAFPADKPRIVGYRAKWEPDSFEYRHTVRRFPDLNGEPDGSALSARMRAAALRCWDIFGLRGYARVDVRVDTDGRVWVLELNANPCLTPDAGFPAAAERAGLAYDRLIERVAAAAQTAPSSAPRR